MLKFILSIIVLFGLVALGNRSIPAGDSNLPPIGKFFSPSTGFWKNGNNHDELNFNIASLSDQVQIYLDERGVPHIFSQNYTDAIRVQGYLHAQNRLFQMDVTSRFTAGRLAEFFGHSMVDIDKIMRRRGLPFAAENALRGYEKHKKSLDYLNAYTEGVNAYISQLKPSDYPIEYKLLNVQVEPWTNLKTALINKSMTYDLCFRNEDDLATKSLELVGEELYEFLFPFRNKKESPIIPPGTDWGDQKSPSVGYLHKKVDFPNKIILKKQDHLPPQGIGSNNWVVSGQKTKNGAPILCNDPHLRLRLPSVWYEMQIHTAETNVYGVSLPGAPGVIIGFNNHLAWGVTNVGIDVLDWYKIKWEDEKKGVYLIDNNALKINQKVEQIKVKNELTILDTVSYTKWGPLPYQDDEQHYLHDYALRWIGHDQQESDELGCFIGLNQAKSLEDYQIAISKFRSPAQNIVCATKTNDIALRVSGNIPNRSIDRAMFLQDGSHSNNTWNGFVPPDQNPMVINPARGFVSSANQVSTDSSYPFPYYGYFAEYRGRLLNKKLASMEQITVADMKKLQTNDESLLSRDGLHMLVSAIDDKTSLSASAQNYLAKLRSWDHTFKAQQIEPALFMNWFEQFYHMTWDEFNSPESKMKIPEFWRTIEIAAENPKHSYFDIKMTNIKEEASDIARLSLERMAKKIDSLISLDPSFNWGMYNANRITHLLNLPAFSTDINYVNGFKYALNATNATNGPSWRMIVEMGDPIQAWGIYPGGQSGRPGDQHYDDMIDDWTKGSYYKLNFMSTVKDADLKNGMIQICHPK